MVLIILATISINSVFGENGLIKRAEASKSLHELEEEKQRLELIKPEVLTDNLGKMTVDQYVEALKENEITADGDITTNPDGSKTVITDTGYSVLIEQDGERNVKITIEGKTESLPPRIKNATAKLDGNNIIVTVDAIRTEGAILKYYYKISGGSYQTEPITADSTAGFTITGIDESEVYTIKAELSNENGTSTKEIEVIEEDMLAAPPKVAQGMIPVKYEKTIGKWIKTTETDESWYKYSSNAKKWANVVLSEATWTNETVNGQTVQALDESKPYSQLVWIPRFSYKITSRYHFNGLDAEAGEIEVAFIDSSNKDKNGKEYTRDTKEEYPTVTDSGTAKGKMEDFVVHPAFNFGGTPLTGFWVGKFEISFQRMSGEVDNTDESGRYKGTDKIVMIKANVSSWRFNTISNAFDVCLNMNKVDNVYGLVEDNATDCNGYQVDPHMLKNDEWGAVAYLSKSKYGKRNEEVYINNNSNYITGIAGDTVSAKVSTDVTNAYNTEKGVKASTTGNIYGVYDMSGGTCEFVAAYIGDSADGLTTYGQSLTKKETPGKYRNVYESCGDTASDVMNYAVAIPSKGHYGDAVYETSSTCAPIYTNSWYADWTTFPSYSMDFFTRGLDCNDATSAGVFAFQADSGNRNKNIGFRVAVPVL